MNRFKIIFFDLDGTLVDHDFHLPSYSIDGVNQLRELDLRIAIATGRTFESAEPYLEQLDIDEHSIFLNGCAIQHPKTKEVLIRKNLELEPSKVLVNAAYDRNLSFKIHFENNDIHKSNDIPWPSEILHFLVGSIKTDIRRSMMRQPIKIVFLRQGGNIELFVEEFLEQHPDMNDFFSFFSSHENYIEVVPNGANKGSSMEHLLGHLGLLPEESIAVGDEQNDYELLRKAGFGVAVETGNPILREVADYSIPPPFSGGSRNLREYICRTKTWFEQAEKYCKT